MNGTMKSTYDKEDALKETTNSALSRLFSTLFTHPSGGIPKHIRLTNVLADAIENGFWQPGEKLPAEEQIAALTPYSLGTVQRALRNLTESGLIVRRHGAGTFVNKSGKRVDEPWHCRFLDDDKATVLPVYTRTLSRKLASDNGPWRRYFDSASQIMRIERIINVNKEFDIYGLFYGSTQTLEYLWNLQLDELDGLNLKEVIISELHLRVTKIVHLVNMTTFSADIADALGAEPHSQGMLVTAIAQSDHDHAIYYQEYYVPPTARMLEFPHTISPIL